MHGINLPLLLLPYRLLNMFSMNQEEALLLQTWLDDPDFIAWANEAGSEAAKRWTVYIDQHPQHLALAHHGREIVLGVAQFNPIPTESTRTEAALTRLMDSPIAKRRFEAQIKPMTLRRRWMTVAAAGIAFILVSAAVVAGLTLGWPWQMQEIQTGYGETQVVHLSDGSVVTLNANSKLSYRKNTPRQVELTGEAYFDVEKKPATGVPFQVYTDDITITVLGTRFNVKKREDATQVYLDEGKVNLASEVLTESLDMKPGDFVAYERGQGEWVATENVSADQTIAWLSGSLLFDHEPLLAALARIEEIYGITFKLEDAQLERDTLTGGVPIDNLEITLETLKNVYNINIQPQTDYYLIYQ